MRSARAYATRVLFLTLTATAAAHAQLPNRAEPLPEITASGQPDAAALAELADDGYVAVIDLRGAGEDRGFDEPEAVEALGMSYVPLPIARAEAVTYAAAAELDEILRAAAGPVLVHCASGNRVGAMLSLVERIRGADAESALATGLEAGLTSTALRAVVEERLQDR